MHKSLLALALLYTAVLTVACLGPAPQSFEGAHSPDKILHITATLVLFLCWYAYGRLVALRRKRFLYVIAIISIITFVYGMIIEVLQGALTDYRTADVYDLLANSAGILIGILVVYVFRNQINSLKTKF